MNFDIKIIFFIFVSVWGLTIIPERALITYVNSKYATNAKLYITRYGRQSPYYINLEGTTQQTWENNVTVHLVFYEFLHNEYRRSFVEINIKLCDAINTEPYIGKMLAMKGVVCPAPPKEYHLLNMSILTQNFTNVWPFEKGKAQFELSSTKEVIGRAYIILRFINTPEKARSRNKG